MQLKNKRILISGGSAGIGKALIAAFLEKGVQDIAVIGRRKEALEKLKTDFRQVNFLMIQGDVSKSEDMDNAIKRINKEWGRLDILVNNAGVVSAGLLTEISDEDIIQQININVTGLILLTKKALPLLKKSSEAGIINISSGYGYIAMPFYSVYAASKAAVRQFSDAIRRELFEFPIHVMTVYPSATDTDMMKTAVVEGMDTAEEVAQASIAGLLSGEINVLLGGKQRAEQVKLNFNDPEEIDKVAQQNFEALRNRTKSHRSM